MAIKTRFSLFFPVLSFFCGSLYASDALIFSTAPTQTPVKTKELYQPLVDHLAKVTGREIHLKPARNFLEYTSNMQKGKYDILFDGPHFVSWRIAQRNHKVVAKLPGDIRFVVVGRDDANIRDYRSLSGKKVCAFESPNLLSLGFLDLYSSPGSQPILVRVKSFQDSLDCVKKGKGVAAIMHDEFWERRTAEQKQGLELLYETDKPYPHRAFSVSNRVDVKTREIIIKALMSKAGALSGQAVLQHFRSKQFAPASSEEYHGMEALLKPVWGYRIQ